MVRNLLRAGFSVTGFDLSETAMATLSQEAGFHAAASVQAAAAEADVLILMLPDSKVIDSLLWTQGLAQQLRPGLTVLDMSSSDPVCSRDNASRLAALGLHFVDAPVSGGVKRAIDGSLSIMIGGEAALSSCSSVLLDYNGEIDRSRIANFAVLKPVCREYKSGLQ